MYMQLTLRLPTQHTSREETSLSLPPISSDLALTPRESCSIPATVDGGRTIFFDDNALSQFRRQTEWLNDDCVTQGSRLLLQHFGTAATRGEPALFSSYVFASHQTSDDLAMWRLCRAMSNLGTKDLWLIPIHRNDSHWTLAIIYWRKRRIAYFDSFGSIRALECDVKV